MERLGDSCPILHAPVATLLVVMTSDDDDQAYDANSAEFDLFGR